MAQGRRAAARRVAAFAFLTGLGLAAGSGVWFAPALVGRAATDALQEAGFPGARVAVTGMSLADGWSALRLGFTADLGSLEEIGARTGVALSGTATLSGTLLVEPVWRGFGSGPAGLGFAPAGLGFAMVPEDCLEGHADGLKIAGDPVILPQGLRICPPASGPALASGSDGGLAVSLLAEVPRLDLPSRGLRADAVALDLESTAERQRGDLLVRSLSQIAKPADFAPFSLTFRAVGQGQGPVALSGSARDTRGLLVLSASGRYDPAAGTGTLAVKTDPVRLEPNRPSLATLSPRYGGLIADASGTIAAKLSIERDIKGLRTKGEVLLRKFGGRVGPVTVAGINGTIALSSLSPLVVPDGQILSVALLDAGLPLTDGLVHFGYGRDGKLDIDRAEWKWAGGALRADPFELSPVDPKGTVTLHAAGIDLAKLLSLVEVDGLEAVGTLSGSLPMRLAPGSLRIDGGVLEAAGPGTLRYDPANPPAALKGEDGSAGNLLLGALTDFRYENLKLTVDGQAGGELAVALAVRGANPSFYDGYPVALNLKVSGALDRILRQSLETTRIPDAVRDRMTEFERKDPRP